MNKIIGRFDQEYSVFYDPDYANNVRKFGRLKLMYYITKCKELILCNTDSILAKMSDEFIVPHDASKIDVSNALVKNIGNYVLIEYSTNQKSLSLPENVWVLNHLMMSLNFQVCSVQMKKDLYLQIQIQLNHWIENVDMENLIDYQENN